MPRQSVVINGREFKSQKDAIEYFKEMLARYRNGQTVIGDDREMLMSLLERHPEADKKIGCGVKKLYKDKTDMPTSCFWIEREDGSRTDFSYRTAISAKGKSLYQEFFDACRNAVQNDLRITKEHFFKKYGDENGKVECDITGERVAIYESHLDHKKPLTFQVLVKTFIEANSIEIKTEMLSMSQDAQFQTTFVDLEIKEKFRRYHHKMAQLRIIKAEHNLSLGGSERITKSRNPVMISAEMVGE
ncbi:MAG TPA: DUF3223 domain-containing protein [Cyanobacteria bacterium UBA11162]|nr:DUF3223 domain-containing protein [Cyanobacteria bacterium UBA11162]